MTGVCLPFLTWVFYGAAMLLMSADQQAAGLFAGMAMMTCGVLGGFVAISFSIFAIVVCLLSKHSSWQETRRNLVSAIGIIGFSIATMFAIVNLTFANWPVN